MGRERDVDGLALHDVPKVGGVPIFAGRPVCRTVFDHERAVACDVAHKL